MLVSNRPSWRIAGAGAIVRYELAGARLHPAHMMAGLTWLLSKIDTFANHYHCADFMASASEIKLRKKSLPRDPKLMKHILMF